MFFGLLLLIAGTTPHHTGMRCDLCCLGDPTDAIKEVYLFLLIIFYLVPVLLDPRHPPYPVCATGVSHYRNNVSRRTVMR